MRQQTPTVLSTALHPRAGAGAAGASASGAPLDGVEAPHLDVVTQAQIKQQNGFNLKALLYMFSAIKTLKPDYFRKARVSICTAVPTPWCRQTHT